MPVAPVEVPERPDQTASWRRVAGSRVVGQAALFAASTGAVMALGVVSKAILARELSPTTFGSFAFATSFLAFAAMFSELGLFLPASRKVANSQRGEQREVIGASFSLFIPVGIAFSAITFGLSFVVDDIFHVQAKEALQIVAPLGFVYAFSQAGDQLCQGADKLHIASISYLVGQCSFVVALVALLATGTDFDVALALLLRSFSLAVAMFRMVAWLRPVFRHVRERARSLIAEARSWGFQVYVGRILSVGTYNMDVLMLAAFTDAKSVGFYVLAGSIATLVGLPVEGLGAALFPRMTARRELDRRWLAAAWAVGIGGVVVVALASPLAVDLVFGDRYGPVAGLAVPLALAQAVRGATTIYNKFLAAQARGRELRNAGIVLTVSNVVLNFALIPPYGAMGAAWASLFALLANLAAHIVSYRRAVLDLQVATS